MIHVHTAILELAPHAHCSVINESVDNIIWNSPDIPQPTKEQILEKLAELQAAEPLRLLRLERNQILQQSDWEVQRNQERNITDTALIEYRNALRDLPQKIEAEEIEAPTLSETGELIFEHWPVRGE